MKANPLDQQIRIRRAIEEDVPFIFSTWLKSYRDSAFAASVSTTIYYAEHHKVVERLLRSCEVLIACSDKDPNELYGYICTEKVDGIFVVHYAYVKHSFRHIGIGTQLLNACNHDASKASMFTHYTKLSRKLAEKFHFVHSPYLALTVDYRTERAKKLNRTEKELIYGNDIKESIEEVKYEVKRIGN